MEEYGFFSGAELEEGLRLSRDATRRGSRSRVDDKDEIGTEKRRNGSME